MNAPGHFDHPGAAMANLANIVTLDILAGMAKKTGAVNQHHSYQRHWQSNSRSSGHRPAYSDRRAPAYKRYAKPLTEDINHSWRRTHGAGTNNQSTSNKEREYPDVGEIKYSQEETRILCRKPAQDMPKQTRHGEESSDENPMTGLETYYREMGAEPPLELEELANYMKTSADLMKSGELTCETGLNHILKMAGKQPSRESEHMESQGEPLLNRRRKRKSTEDNNHLEEKRPRDMQMQWEKQRPAATMVECRNKKEQPNSGPQQNTVDGSQNTQTSFLGLRRSPGRPP